MQEFGKLFWSSYPVCLAHRAVAVGASVPWAGWLDVVQATIPADGVSSQGHANIVVCFNHKLPETYTTF